jgi:hypothetical protein
VGATAGAVRLAFAGLRARRPRGGPLAAPPRSPAAAMLAAGALNGSDPGGTLDDSLAAERNAPA